MKRNTGKRSMLAVLLTLCMLLSAFLAGCSGKPSEKEITEATTKPAQMETQKETQKETEAPTEEIDPEVMDSVKYNIYVQMNNYMIRVLDNLYNYYEVVEYADEFALLSDSEYTYKYGISPLDSSIVDDAAYAASMEPAYEKLDDLALKSAEPMKTLMDTFSDLYRCYDFADNQYAKAKEFHTVIQKYAAEFEDLAYAFMDEVSLISEERVAADEQRMLEEGFLIAYNASHAITVANKLLDECYSQGVYDDNITELNLEPIRPLYDELVATVDAFHEATSDNNQLMKESLSNSSPMYGLLDSLIQSVEWMIKQVESKVPIQDPGREYLGGIIHIEEVLSDCIGQYNSVFAE